MSEVKFVDKLPDARNAAFWDALIANPGKWAEYPGKPNSVYTLAASHSRNGVVFEASVRGGTGYLRAVAS